MRHSAPVPGPSISLIVPCHSIDRADDIVRLITSVEAQAPALEQVVFVVQRSRELLARLEERLASSPIPDIRIEFIDSTPGVAHARNVGVDAATGDIIAFADDDSQLADDWSEQTRLAYSDDAEMIGLAGAILPAWDAPAMSWFPRELYWMLSCTYWDDTRPVRVRNGYGANMSFRREAFAAGRRFNESLGVGAWATGGWRGVGGEEPEFCLRLTAETGRPVMYVPDVRAWHRVRPYRLEAGTIVRRGYYEGVFKGRFAATSSGGQAVLDTEHELLRTVARNSVERLRLALSQPLLALRQQGAVDLAVTAVLCGYGVRRIRSLARRSASNEGSDPGVPPGS
jgi:glycosyltransferase involved in cell wall biosynthesis